MNPDFLKDFPEISGGAIPEQKKALRQYMRHLIKNYHPEERKKADSVILEKLCEDKGIRQAECILCYYGMPGEPATHDFMERMLREGKRIALPKCDPERSGRMKFYEIRNLHEIKPGLYGIPEPTEKIPVTPVHPDYFHLNPSHQMSMIVPGLAFTPSGDRLGRGGGYYDRFLQDYPTLDRIGVCYHFMIVPEIPGEIHDSYSHVSRLVTDG